jgi:dTDP-4-amino-4,6-dideoxygalactose transaminase
LKTLGIGGGDEVILQALTCVAVPNSIMWTGARPVYSDVGKDFNLDIKDVSEKLSENTKAIIIQHSFGIPADVDQLKKISRKAKKKIYLIEDCALALGATYKRKSVGTLGDIAFFSFGRDKVISSVFGGMILCKEGKLYESLKRERDKLNYPSPVWLLQQLFHPLVFALALPVYNFGVGKFGLGKAIIYICQKLGIISKAIYWEEELGKRPVYFPLKMPGALAALAINQLNKLEDFNIHRRKIVELYSKKLAKLKLILPPQINGAIWVRYPVVTDKMSEIFSKFKARGILLGDWYKECVVPVKGQDLVGYSKGSCPKAESMAGKILNLPTYPNMDLKDAERVVSLMKS